MNPAPPLVLAPLLLLPLACSPGGPPPTATVWDSAGIRIVESTLPRWEGAPPWVVEEVPVLDLATTGQGPNHEFYQVRDALRLPDGGIVVANHGSSEVRFFDPSGGFVGSVGRHGEGPGEFQRLEKVSLMPGDSIAVADYWLRRITILSPGGDVGRVISLQGVADRVRHLITLGDSGFVGLAYSYAAFPDEPGNYRMPYKVVRLGMEGRVLDTIVDLEGFEASRGPAGEAAVPWGKDGHLAVHGTELVVGSAEELAVDWYDGGGALFRRIRVPSLDLRITQAEIDSVERAFREAQVPAGVRQLMGGIRIPERRPAYSDLLIDAEGCLWAARYFGRRVGDTPVDWEVFAAEGRWLGTVRTPARFTVFQIGSDYILGVLRDELEVEHVQLLRLTRG